jgi:hypothetical protein
MASKETLVRKASTVPTSATTPNDVSAVLYIGDLEPATVALQASGTASATLVYETSIDKTVWVQCGASLVETTAFTDQTAMTTAGTNPRASALWARLRCSVFSSITSVAFAVAGVPKSL